MKFRKNVLPHRPVDIICFLLMVLVYPVCILITLYLTSPEDPESGWFRFTEIYAAFTVYNILSNLAACMLVDTSVDPQIDLTAKEHLDWRLCTICDRMVPSKYWHCSSCGVCILKRDHHCTFTGCCIGHRNARYFICFALHLFIGSIYSSVYLMIYIYQHKVGFHSIPYVIPISMQLELKAFVLYFFLSLAILLLVLSFLVSVFFYGNVMRGGVGAAKIKGRKYTWNEICRSFRNILGHRMHLVWLSPLIESKLPNDGYASEELKLVM